MHAVVFHLHSKLGPNPLDGIPHVHAAVNGNDLHIALGHALQKAPAAADVQDEGQIGVGLLHRVHNLVNVGPSKDIVVLWG